MAKTERAENAAHLFQGGLNCSQAILSVFGEPYGLDQQTAEELGRPLGGGLGRMGLTCGALTGAILVLGLAERKAQNETEARNNVARSVQELVGRFEDCHGSSLCKVLLGADMSTAAGMKKIKEENMVAQICPGLVRDAAEILAEILERSLLSSD